MFLKQYEKAKNLYASSIKTNISLGQKNVDITPKKVIDSILELYKLKHNGKKLRELYDCQKKARSNEHQSTEFLYMSDEKQNTTENKAESMHESKKLQIEKNKKGKENNDSE